MSNDEVIIIPKIFVKDTIDLLNSLDRRLAKIVSMKLHLPDELVGEE